MKKTFLTFRNIVFFELLIPTQLFFDPYDILTNFHKMQCLTDIRKYCRRKYAKYFQFIKYFVNIALKNVGYTFVKHLKFYFYKLLNHENVCNHFTKTKEYCGAEFDLT